MAQPFLLDEKTVFSHILPKGSELHKGTAGKVYVVAGSRAFCGAAVMAVSGALASGCGYVTLASTRAVCRNAAAHLMTPTFTPLPQTPQGRVSGEAYAVIREQSAAYDCLLMGCGLGMEESIRDLVCAVLSGFRGKLVLDADGINALSGNIDMLREASGEIVLTPHEGEMARLMSGSVEAMASIEAVHANRLQAARTLARAQGITVVLKGPRTLIVSCDGREAVNATGNSGLGKAGSGDILSGMIASFLAQGLDAFWAAACGVYLHGAAADLTAARLSKYCMQPPDLLDSLPTIFLRNGR